MGTVLNIDLDGDGAYRWLPLARAKLAVMNARPQASALRCVVKIDDADIEILRGNVVDTIKVTVGLPYLLVSYIFSLLGGGGGIAWGEVGDSGTTPRVDVGFTNVASTVVQVFARMPYAGDNFVLLTQSNSASSGQQDTDFCWPVMARVPFFGALYDAADPSRVAHSTAFTELAITGLQPNVINFAGVPTGWKDETTRYRFVYGATYWTDNTNPTTRDGTRVPIAFVGNTENQTLVQVEYPYYAGYRHLFTRMHCIGPGKVQALQCTDWNASQAAKLPTVDPYLTLSTDHGETWALVDTSFLSPYLYYKQPGTGDTARAANIGFQLGVLSQSVIIGLGNDQSLLVIPNGWVDMGGAGGAPRFAPMAFLGSAGAGYTRVAWPLDTAYCAADGFTLGDRVIFALQQEDARNGQYAFGVGCAYVPVSSGGAYCIMATQDSGSTWTISPPLPSAVLGPNGAACCVVLEPCVPGKTLGKLLFAAPDYAGNRQRFQVTDGAFTSFKNLGAFAPVQNGTMVFPTNTAWYNYAVTNFGKSGRQYVYPAFPHLFDRSPT